MKALRPLFAALAVAGLTLVLVAAWQVDRAGLEDTATRADALVVLGARVDPGGVPSPTLRARVEHAVNLYRRGVAPRLVFSGGVGDYGPSEAHVARGLAVSLGVPAEACVLEEDSHSTAQNAVYSAPLLRERGWHRVVLVTDPYHQLRAQRLFRAQGLSVRGGPVLAAPRHRALLSRVGWTLREVAALTRDRLAHALDTRG